MIGPVYKVVCDVCAKWLAPSSMRGHMKTHKKVEEEEVSDR